MFLGIDIGTQSLKVVVVDEGLKFLGSASVAYGVGHPRPGWAQQDPVVWEEAVSDAVPRALVQAGLEPEDINAVAVSGLKCNTGGREKQGIGSVKFGVRNTNLRNPDALHPAYCVLP